MLPKDPLKNLAYRSKLLHDAENDEKLQEDILVACKESYLYWTNTFAWTYHQFDVDPATGEKIEAKWPHVPFITWDIQDVMFDELHWSVTNGKDIIINKSRDMGASWCCLDYIHWEWLFHEGGQYLEMSRTKGYVDEYGNMKALLPKHDYINSWLPYWMLPPGVLPGGKNRKCMHMKNELNGACIDGESTTEHAASGDRRRIILLDEFAKVKYGKQMRNATRDAALCRFINSTVAGPGTEYSKMKKERRTKIFSLMYWDHPDKGSGRYVKQDPLTKNWEIRSPWFDREEQERSSTELAQEVLAQDIESGDVFFELSNVDTHTALFCYDPIIRLNIGFVRGVADDGIGDIIRSSRTLKRLHPKVKAVVHPKGTLRVWAELIDGRLDQSYTYSIGGDISKGHGASNSVLSVICNETKEKVAEWKDSHTPPFMMARQAAALAIWVGGRAPKALPFLIWEKNGPGKDFGQQLVTVYRYPYFYRTPKREGTTFDGVGKKYGWQSTRESKQLLLRNYDRAIAQGNFINHSLYGMTEMKSYIYYTDGGIGPSELLEDGQGARETHGDIVIADALCLLGSKKTKRQAADADVPETCRSAAWRKAHARNKKKKTHNNWRTPYDNT